MDLKPLNMTPLSMNGRLCLFVIFLQSVHPMDNIREASFQDFKSIYYLSQFLGYEESSEKLAAIRFQNILDSIDDKVWIFEVGNSIYGWLHVFTAYRIASPHCAEIGGLVVDPSCRRQGIGGRLVDHATNWAKLKNLSLRVRCNSTRKDTHEFYTLLGFSYRKTQYVLDWG